MPKISETELRKLLQLMPEWEMLQEMPGQVMALKRRVADLEAQLPGKAIFAPHGGALFQKKRGQWERAVFCPYCKTKTGEVTREGDAPHFGCACGWHSSFSVAELDEVMKTLPK